ncbi:MAG: aldose 1-epimerase family protein [Aerococcaceae bacterium]|nr:aldose 1-epimerase family protein [Aerococcaceae bacterium]
MITLQSDALTVTIRELGAELASIQDRKTGYEFLWQADANYWPRQAPVLFPIVGGLKGSQYRYKDQAYTLPRHGFARDKVFSVHSQTAEQVTFELTHDEETLNDYPFEFTLHITYRLQGNQLTVSYDVWNPSTEQPLYYSIGGHPAFNVSHNEHAEFEGVTYHFTPEKAYTRLPMSQDWNIDTAQASRVVVPQTTLTHDTFHHDALIYEIDEQTEVVLTDAPSGTTIRLQAQEMPYLGIWSPYPAKAPFVCIEPWAGIADTEDATGELTNKLGIQHLAANQHNTHHYTMTFEKA